MVGTHLCGCLLPWLAAMRLEVAARKSGFLWRRTDDEHSTCALCPRECSAEVLFGGHYELGGCTEEYSASRAPAGASRQKRHAPLRLQRPLYG